MAMIGSRTLTILTLGLIASSSLATGCKKASAAGPNESGQAPVVNVSTPPSPPPPPAMRRVVVAIKAENGANLPVVYLGKVMARTDASGAAHFAIDAAPGGQFDVLLDTSGKENARLKPQSPSRPFTVGQSDDIFIYEQKFDVEKKKRGRHAAKAKVTGPECIGCGG